MATAAAIQRAIRTSNLTDTELAEIARITSRQRQLLALEASQNLGVGDRVRLARIKPKYMQGQTGEVVTVEPGGKFLIKLDRPQGRFQGGQVLVHPTCVEPE